MFKIIDVDAATPTKMENGRGEIFRLINTTLGTEKIDLHLNRLFPGGPAGNVHRHTVSDNVYIVRTGEGRLQVNGEVHTVRAGQVVYIAAGVHHSLSNASPEIFEVFEIYAPAGASFDFLVS